MTFYVADCRLHVADNLQESLCQASASVCASFCLSNIHISVVVILDFLKLQRATCVPQTH